MRLSYLFIIFVFTFIFSFQTVLADCTITSMLRTGFKGAEVQCLQEKVGAVQDGNFGPLTKIAVRAFQSRNGLVADGIVGPLTQAVLNGIVANNSTYPVGCTGITGYSPTTGAKCDGSINSSTLVPQTEDTGLIPLVANNNVKSVNPNLANLDQLIETVVEVNRKNGFSEQELALMADTVRKVVTSSDMDFNKEFKELLVKESQLSINLKNQSPFAFFNKAMEKTLSFLGVNPSVAQAAAGIPFGGALVFPFFCAYNASWMITVSPLPPTYVVLLTYYPGTQGFASYNIPFTRWLLGSYTPPGFCVIPGGLIPITIPTEGTITPMVGSSPG